MKPNNLPILTLKHRKYKIELWERNKEVIDLYVLGTNPNLNYWRTLKEIGKHFGISKQMVDEILTKRQIRSMTPNQWTIAKLIGNCFLHETLNTAEITERVAKHPLIKEDPNLNMTEKEIWEMVQRLINLSPQSRLCKKGGQA